MEHERIFRQGLTFNQKFREGVLNQPTRTLTILKGYMGTTFGLSKTEWEIMDSMGNFENSREFLKEFNKRMRAKRKYP